MGVFLTVLALCWIGYLLFNSGRPDWEETSDFVFRPSIEPTIEDRVEKLERAEKCRNGWHEWAVNKANGFYPDISCGYSIECKHCCEDLPAEEYNRRKVDLPKKKNKTKPPKR